MSGPPREESYMPALDVSHVEPDNYMKALTQMTQILSSQVVLVETEVTGKKYHFSESGGLGAI